jgi:hypothetical protein
MLKTTQQGRIGTRGPRALILVVILALLGLQLATPRHAAIELQNAAAANAAAQLCAPDDSKPSAPQDAPHRADCALLCVAGALRFAALAESFARPQALTPRLAQRLHAPRAAAAPPPAGARARSGWSSRAPPRAA